MNIVPVAERPIKLGDGVHAAISLFKETYGGVLTFDSGHADTPTLIYTFPSYGNAQVATRNNKDKLSLYLRATTRDGRPLQPILRSLAEVEKVYPRDGNPAHSLLREATAWYLTPKHHSLLLVAAKVGTVRTILDLYLGLAANPPRCVERYFRSIPERRRKEKRSDKLSPLAQRGGSCRAARPQQCHRKVWRADRAGG